MLEGLASAGLDSRATRGVVDHGTRLVDGRQSQSELMFGRLRAAGQPFGVRWRWLKLVMRLQPRRHLRLEMPATAIWRQRRRRWARGFRASVAESSDQMRWSQGREPGAREQGDSTGSRDNKSVAEAGKRHLLQARTWRASVA